MALVPDKNWVSREEIMGLSAAEITQRVEGLLKSGGLNPLQARLLALRGITEETVTEYLRGSLTHLPDPFLLKGMRQAADRIVAEIQAGGRPLISADFDVDGITACSLLLEFFTELGISAHHFIPDRRKDGYGLSKRALKRAADVGVSLVISVDCGISAIEEAAYAKQLDLDLIVTDHHQTPEVLPEAFAIVNPHQADCPFPFSELSGAGVAFFLAIAVRKTLREAGYFQDRPEPDLRRSLDLAALSAIADIVPLKGVNRILTRAGLHYMESGSRPGIAALQQAANISRISSGTVGFGLGPRLNATGRLADGRQAVKLLLEQDPTQAMEIATAMDKLNRERQEVEKQIVKEAVLQVENGQCGQKSIVVAGEGWHPGVIGIVASRLVELYHRPTVVISLDGEHGKGSGRSIRGFNLFQAFTHCQEHLSGFGGHEAAAGLGLNRADLPAFAAAFDQLACSTLSDEDMKPTLPYDTELSVGEIDIPIVESLETLEPFGMGNPGPVFVARGVKAHKVRTVGADGSHLSFFVSQNSNVQLKCIAFQMGDRCDGLEGQTLDILFKASINEFRGERTVQAEIKDIRAV